MKKPEALELLNQGHLLIQIKRPDFGTTSMTRPIKQTGKEISSFTINSVKIHATLGYSLIKELTKEKSERKGLSTAVYYSLKK